MPEADRRRWNEKYLAGSHASSQPSKTLTALKAYLPRSGRALELAGGASRNAIWLAQRGLDVTLADISDEGLAIAAQRAAETGIDLATLQVDLEHEPLPDGPWDLILSVHYLWRPLFPEFPSALGPGGLLVVIQPTKKNLERHAKPPERFLLDDGELPNLVSGLEVLHYDEGWLADGLHEAVLVAKR